MEQYLDVIAAETAEMTQELTVIQLHGQSLMTSRAVLKALGGGWKDKW